MGLPSTPPTNYWSPTFVARFFWWSFCKWMCDWMSRVSIHQSSAASQLLDAWLNESGFNTPIVGHLSFTFVPTWLMWVVSRYTNRRPRRNCWMDAWLDELGFDTQIIPNKKGSYVPSKYGGLNYYGDMDDYFDTMNARITLYESWRRVPTYWGKSYQTMTLFLRFCPTFNCTNNVMILFDVFRDYFSILYIVCHILIIRIVPSWLKWVLSRYTDRKPPLN